MLVACQGDRVTGATASRFGRYEVLGAFPGREGSDTFVAFDERHGRKVTLRIISIQGLGPEALASFSRQLKAFAKVRHPSLPTVYDMGTEGTELYIAEEAAVGLPLDAWLQARRRSWRDIARVFVSVAGAVAAIHGAGLVCRHLRSADIVVTKDLRVTLVDAGLHAPRATGAGFGSAEEASERPGDSRTDQLAMCNLLHAALFRTSAFAVSPSGAPTFELVDTTNLSPTIPPTLRDLLDRGLARDPAARFPAMVHLASTLHSIVERRRHAPRLIGAALAVAVLSVSTGAVVGAWVRGGTPFASIVEQLNHACDQVEPTFVGVWGPQREAELRRTLWRSNGPDASLAWLTVRRHLDTWTAKWQTLRRETCEPRRGASGGALLTAQRTIGCLADARAQLVAFLDEVPELGPRRAVLGAYALSDPGVCPSLTTALWIDGIRKGAIDPGTPNRDDLGLRAVFQWADGASDAAISDLEQAIAAQPEDAANEQLAVNLGNLGRLRAEAGKVDEAQAVLRRAIGVRERLGHQDDIATAQLWHDLGTVLGRRQQTVDSLAAHQRALDIEAPKLGAESLEAAATLRAVARLQRDAGRYEESLNNYRRALAIRRAELGEESGEVAVSNIELGWALIAAGKAGEAVDRFVIAEHVGQRVTGRVSRLVARALEGRGVSDVGRGQAAKAIPLLEEALATLQRTGSDAGQISRTQFHLATALLAAGADPARARRLATGVRDRMLDEGQADTAEGRAVSAWLSRLEGTAP